MGRRSADLESLNPVVSQDDSFPSSFLRDPKENEIDSSNCCSKPNYLIRRYRRFWILFLFLFFIVAGVITSVQLGLFHGHLVVVDEATMNRRNFTAYPPSSSIFASLAGRTAAGPLTPGATPAACSNRTKILSFLFATICYTAFLYHRGGAGSYLEQTPAVASVVDAVETKATTATDYGKITPDQAEIATTDALPRRTLSITTWNIAAINNNPFEYWLTVDDNPDYEALMNNVEKFIEYPGKLDIRVDEVFTEEMFTKLEAQMTKVGWESVSSYWNDDFRNRLIVSQFLKDPLLGNKRLASMPDRVTNTINVVGSSVPVCRPTVINMYEGDLGTMDKWYKAWEEFMFVKKLTIPWRDGANKQQIPYEMLQPIKKAKYPDITEEEERVSLPLQTLCGAIFDGILVHMMNTLSGPDVWQPLKKTIVESLNKQKVPKTLEILDKQYAQSDIITLQEVSTALVNLAKKSDLGKRYHIIAPADMDATRDQNSIILLKKETFPKASFTEITSDVVKNFPEGVKVPVANGDILALTTEDKDDIGYVIASFHGDTNGLATIPVLQAIRKTMATTPKMNSKKLIFGLDANTYETGSAKKQDVAKFGNFYLENHLTSCWGDHPDPKNYTTYNARTYLQPQLNKACKSSEKRECGDVNPKDFILFAQEDFQVVSTWKDNTGKMLYTEDMAFPTLDFPSDHGILSTTIEYKK